MHIEDPKKNNKPHPQTHQVEIWIPVDSVSPYGEKYIDKKPACIDKDGYVTILKEQVNSKSDSK